METRRFTLAEHVVVDFPLRPELDRILSSLAAFRACVRDEEPESAETFEAELLQSFLKELPECSAHEIRDGESGEGDALERACIAYVLHLLDWSDRELDVVLEIERADAVRARFYPAFQRMRALRDAVGAERGIPFLKAYIDHRIHTLTEPDETIENVDLYWDEVVDPDFQSPTSGIAVRFHEGRSAFRIDRCLWADVMKPLGDPEISFLVCCYGDTAGVEALSPHLAYTCPMTLVEGDPFCDKCLHDRRFVSEVEHPSRAFYEGMGAKEAFETGSPMETPPAGG